MVMQPSASGQQSFASNKQVSGTRMTKIESMKTDKRSQRLALLTYTLRTVYFRIEEQVRKTGIEYSRTTGIQKVLQKQNNYF